MDTCANCTRLAEYRYYNISYCSGHLPRFLRDRNGKVTPIVEVIEKVVVPEVIVATQLFPEIILEDLPVVPPARKKAVAKAK